MGKFEKRKFEGHHKGKFHQNKRPRENFSSQGPRLTEVDVGVTEYVSDYPGFSGIIKQRYEKMNLLKFLFNLVPNLQIFGLFGE